MQVCKIVLQPFLSPAEHLCLSAGAAYANVVPPLLNAKLLTQSKEYKLFWKLCTLTTLFWMQTCHRKRLKEGHLLLLVLLNAITSPDLPLKLLVWALTFKAKCTRLLAYSLNSRTHFDWKELGIPYKFRFDHRSKRVERWQWVAGTVLQISLVSITAGQIILLCVHLHVDIS